MNYSCTQMQDRFLEQEAPQEESVYLSCKQLGLHVGIIHKL